MNAPRQCGTIALALLAGLAAVATLGGCRETHTRKEDVMNERTGLVTFKGGPLTLVGDEVKVGQPAPDVELLANDLSAVKLSSFQGKVRIVTSVPSLDTSVCDTETRKFNEAAGQLGDDAVVLTVSMDLPFAQARWCGAAGVENVQTLSDHREAAFGTAYGVLIKELRLLARAVFVVDKDGVVRYHELVGEVTDEPDYEAALKAARELM
jgi:thiol peroxidase